MAVPYIFSTTPGGSSIPLAWLDADFSYLTTSPAFAGNVTVGGSLGVAGPLSVTGASTFTGLVTMNGGLTLNGPFTVNGITVNPTGITGSGLLVFNTAPTLVSPNLGTPASGDLVSCTGYPVTSVVGMGAGVIPFLTSPTCANLAAAVVDETGSGNLVFSNNPVLTAPTMTNPVLGTPTSGDLTNCTGYAASNLTGVVPVANGGTGMTTTGAVGDVIVVSAPGVLGYAASAPAASIAGGAASQILYQSAPNATSFLPNGTLGQVLISNGVAAPAWGNINLSASISGVLPIANGGTGNSTMGTGVQTALTNNADQKNGLLTYASLPAGAVMFFAMNTAPSTWLVANGAAVSRTVYADLFAAIGVLYGAGDGSTTFNLPNLNGQFVRGWDSSGAVDPGRTFGSNQADTYLNHTHGITDPGHSHTCYTTNPAGTASGGPSANPNGQVATPTSTNVTGITVNNSTTGGTETRPKNVALLACIKY